MRISLPLIFVFVLPARCSSHDPAAYARLFENNMPMFVEMSKQVHSTQPSTVLDIGTGPGEPSTMIAKANPSARIIATDFQEGMLEQAKQRAKDVQNVEFKQASGDDLSAFGDASVDAVTMCYVLMFIPDRLKSMVEVLRVLRAGGRAYIAVWKQLEIMNMVQESLGQLSAQADPTPLSVNPLALQAKDAVENIVFDSSGSHSLKVLSTQNVSYPFTMPTGAQMCDGFSMTISAHLKKIEDEGFQNATDAWCTILLQKMEAAGFKKADGSFEATGNTAQLLVLQKDASPDRGLWL